MKSRIFISALTVAALVVTASGCSGSAENQIVVGSFGGDYDKNLEEYVHPVFNETVDNTEVIFSSGDVNTLVTKLGAEKGGQGSYDVVQMSMKRQAQPIEDGVFEKLDPEKIPNWDNIDPKLRNDYCIPHIHSPITLITNTDSAKPLTEWGDYFGDDEVLKKSGIWSNWLDYIYYPAANEAEGEHPGENWSEGYDDAAHAASLMRMYGSAEQNGQGLISGEIDYMIGPRSRAAQWSEQSGTDFSSVVPESGTFSYISTTCIPKNAPNKDAAYAYLNAELDAEAQQGFATSMYYAPTVTNVELEGETAEQIAVTKEEQEHIRPIDWNEMLNSSQEMRELWDQATS